MARTPQERRTIEEERIAGAARHPDPASVADQSPVVTGSGYAYTCMSKEWRDFGFGWNAMVHALRSRDHLSNEERDELLFVTLTAPAHREFFGGEYMALPTMLTVRRDETAESESQLETLILHLDPSIRSRSYPRLNPCPRPYPQCHPPPSPLPACLLSPSPSPSLFPLPSTSPSASSPTLT